MWTCFAAALLYERDYAVFLMFACVYVFVWQKTEENEKDEQLKKEKHQLMEEYNKGLECLKSDIVIHLTTIRNSKFLDEKKRDKLINKFLFMERQLCHDFFSITFEW